MKSPNIFKQFSILAILSLVSAFAPSGLHAQWYGDSTHNTMICDTTGQQDFPAAVSDGQNGAIVVWEDQRSGTYTIYAQHVNANGIPLWNRNGIPLCKKIVVQRFPIITTDNNGGAYVVWDDSRYSATMGNVYYAQHLLADGSLAYPDTGLAVAVAAGGRQNPTICDDGFGNAFVAWGDNRSKNQGSQPDIYMNKLWPHGVKYNDSISTTSIGSVRRKPGFGNQPQYFADANAHFLSVGLGSKGSAANALTALTLVIAGKSYDIESITDDTSLTLKTYPSNAENFRYYFKPWRGRVVDSTKGKQTNPIICSDGKGGCYLAWQNSQTSPVSIKGMHFDSALNVKWTRGYPDSAGFLIYKGSDYRNNASGLTMARDTASGQLMMAWEVTNIQSNDTQDVWGTRLNCATDADTSQLWGSAVQITGDALLNQVRPMVFSDDSDWTSLSGKKSSGLMVPYRTGTFSGDPSDWDVAMTRMKGDGSTALPGNGSSYKIASQPLGQIGFRAVKVDTGLLMVAWVDARNDGAPDSCIYAQVIDKWGFRHFPTWKTSYSGGMPITGHTNTGGWTAKQVTLVPRASGAIAIWTDFRKGTSDPGIYAQLIMKDGTRVLPYAKASVSTERTHGSDCNAQSTSVTITDTASAVVGFKSAAVVSSTNMAVQLAPVVQGQPVTFTTLVTDSMKDAQAIVSVTDTVGNVTYDTVSYCTIKDVAAPIITTNTFTKQDIAIAFTVSETRPWDRLLDSIKVTGANFTLNPKPTRQLLHGLASFTFTGTQTDTLSQSVICVTALDAAGNVASRSCDTLPAKELAGQNGVGQSASRSNTLRVYPNPSTDLFTVSIDGNGALQECDVIDLLGRNVAHFSVRGQTTFDASSLPNGTYILRIGDRSVSIVKQ